MYEFPCMNTSIKAFDVPEKTRHKVQALFKKSEQTLSRFDSSSELSQLNRSFHIPFLCSSILFAAIKTAEKYYRCTKGIFNPYLGKQITELGYHCSFENIQQTEIVLPIQRLNTKIDDSISINNGMRSITLQKRVQIDLGGIAKGWTAQCISELLQEEGYSNGVLVAGGDITVWGAKKQEKTIRIEHPVYEHSPVCSFVLQNDAGIATSSIKKRKWLASSGDVLHHILDPRTSLPSDSDLMQASVIAPTLTDAEVFAKCLLVLGWKDGLALLHSFHKPIISIGITTTGELLYDGDLTTYLRGGIIV
ncbi:MAG: FAD:protein FMN transferase [Bacillus sp. (in: firmicutes)]